MLKLKCVFSSLANIVSLDVFKVYTIDYSILDISYEL